MRPSAYVLVSVTALLALSACSGPVPPPPSSPAPTVTVTATVTAPAESAAPLDVTAFRSESTTCQFDAPDAEQHGVGCQMMADYTYAIPDAWLDYGIACSDISLGYEDAQGRLGCASDVSYPDAAESDPLPAGTVVAHGGITCTLLAVGVSCTNGVGGVATITPEAYVASTD
jgi:hypothetical protein